MESIIKFAEAMETEFKPIGIEVSFVIPNIIQLKFPEGAKVSDDHVKHIDFVDLFIKNTGSKLPVRTIFEFYEYGAKLPAGQPFTLSLQQADENDDLNAKSERYRLN